MKARKVFSALFLGLFLMLLVFAQYNWVSAVKHTAKYKDNPNAQRIVMEQFGFDGTEEPGVIRKVVALFKN